MARKDARRIAMQLIYQYELGGEGIASTIEESVDKPDPALTSEDLSYIEDVVLGCMDKAADLDTRISARAKGWAPERISRVDLAILRLALYEILCREDVPTSVAINEACDLAHVFSGDKASAFINGVLGSIVREDLTPAQAPVPPEGG